jgi:hypothetical protein
VEWNPRWSGDPARQRFRGELYNAKNFADGDGGPHGDVGGLLRTIFILFKFDRHDTGGRSDVPGRRYNNYEARRKWRRDRRGHQRHLDFHPRKPRYDPDQDRFDHDP